MNYYNLCNYKCCSSSKNCVRKNINKKKTSRLVFSWIRLILQFINTFYLMFMYSYIL